MEYSEKVSRIQGLLDGTAYRAVNPDTRWEALATRITTMRLRRGETTAVADALSVAKILDSDLVDFYGSLAMDEVGIALDWGMKGEFGDYTAVNAANLYKFVRKYAESDERREAVDRQKAARSLPAPKLDERGRWVAEWYEREKAAVNARRHRKAVRAGAVEYWDRQADEVASVWRRFTAAGVFPAVPVISRPGLERMYRAYAWLQAVGLAQRCMVWSEVTELEERGRTDAAAAGMDEETGILLGGAYALKRCCVNAMYRGLDLSGMIGRLKTETTDDAKAEAYIGRRGYEKN